MLLTLLAAMLFRQFRKILKWLKQSNNQFKNTPKFLNPDKFQGIDVSSDINTGDSNSLKINNSKLNWDNSATLFAADVGNKENFEIEVSLHYRKATIQSNAVARIHYYLVPKKKIWTVWLIPVSVIVTLCSTFVLNQRRV